MFCAECFHGGYESAKDMAEQWQQENDKGVDHDGARFCGEDRRASWSSHDLNLDPIQSIIRTTLQQSTNGCNV